MPSWGNPVLIDPVNDGFAPAQGPFPSPDFFGKNAAQPPVNFGGKIYIVLSSLGVTTDPAGVYRSTDNGATWSAALDAAHAPGFNNAVPVFDGNHTLYVIYSMTISSSSLQPVRITAFNLQTETWGSNLGDTANPYLYASTAFLRSDGSIIALLASGIAAGPRPTGFSGATWVSGSGWTNEFTINTNNIGAPNSPGPAGALDANGVLHVLLYNNNPTTVYQRINPDNSLGQHVTIPSAIAPSKDYAVNFCIFQNQLVVGSSANNVGFYTCPLTGTPLFTLSAANPDPGGPDDSFFGGVTTSVSADGTTCYLVYASNLTGQVRVCTTTDLVNWTAETAATEIDNEPPAVLPAVIYPSLIPTGLAVVYGDPVSSASFFVTKLTPAVPTPPPPMLGGGSSSRLRCGIVRPNEFWQRAKAILAEHIRNRADSWPYLHEFGDPMSIEQMPVASIQAPVAGTLTSILTYQVPLGFRFYLWGLLEDFEGTGGSGAGGAFAPGDALFTVDINVQSTFQGQGVQGLIAVSVPIGSIAAGRWWEFPRPYEFAASTKLRSAVKNVNITPGSPNFFTSMFLGYLEPVE